jgi:hypothetical protein
MENALIRNKAEQIVLTKSASITAAGRLPSKLAHVTSEVLARLLSGEHMTELENVHVDSIAQLDAFIYFLEIAYSWTVERKKNVVVSKNGRMVLVSEYWIDPEVIVLAKAAGADVWCTEVRAARCAMRAKAAHARRLPNRGNAARLTGSYLQQQSLFDKKMDASHGPL